MPIVHDMQIIVCQRSFDAIQLKALSGNANQKRLGFSSELVIAELLRFRQQSRFMFVAQELAVHKLKHKRIDAAGITVVPAKQSYRGRGFYNCYGKRVFDISFSLLLLPLTVVVGLGFLIVNPFFNKGPLLYIQPRMGVDCRAFPAVKFRSMVPASRISRKADEPLETHRITKLGRFMRKTRLDELPQVWNVLRGEMSLIGPRPDYYHHARKYIRSIPGYRARHAVRPGISGLAQTAQGYAHSIEETRAKVDLDLRYIQEINMRMDAYVFFRTIQTVLFRKGS